MERWDICSDILNTDWIINCDIECCADMKQSMFWNIPSMLHKGEILDVFCELKVASFFYLRHKEREPLFTKRATSYRKISWTIKAARFGLRLLQSLWNLTRHLGGSAAAMPVTFQSDTMVIPSNIAASGFHELLQKGVISLSEYRSCIELCVISNHAITAPDFTIKTYFKSCKCSGYDNLAMQNVRYTVSIVCILLII